MLPLPPVRRHFTDPECQYDHYQGTISVWMRIALQGKANPMQKKQVQTERLSLELSTPEVFQAFPASPVGPY